MANSRIGARRSSLEAFGHCRLSPMLTAGFILGVLFVVVAVIGTIRTIVDTEHFPFLHKVDDKTRLAYLALLLLAAGLIALPFVPPFQVTSVDIAGIKANVGKLETRVDTLSEQMEAFFKKKHLEIFDRKHNWKRVRVLSEKPAPNTSGMSDYRIRVALAEDPIPASVEVWWGINFITDYKLEGRVLTLDIQDDSNVEPLQYTDVRVIYYPRAAATSSAPPTTSKDAPTMRAKPDHP